MKDLNITINGFRPWQIQIARDYAKNILNNTLEACLKVICQEWINKSIEQIHEHKKVK